MFDPAAMQPPSDEEIQRMGALIEDFKKKGHLIETGGVMNGALELKFTRKNGRDTITDGPFAEAKEVVGGFALLEVSDREEALKLTREFMDLVGDGSCILHEVTSP
jgi:hypothetical protein